MKAYTVLLAGSCILSMLAVSPGQSAPAEEKTQTLLDGLKDPDIGVRVIAARKLGELKDPRIIKALAPALCASDKLLRLAAVESIGKVGNDAAVAELIAALKDSEPEVVSAAVKGLASSGGAKAAEALTGALGQMDQNTADQVCDMLREMGEAGIKALANALNSPAAVRKRAAEALVAMSETEGKVAATLAAALSSPDWHVREAVLTAMAQGNRGSREKKSDEFLKPLLACAGDESTAVQMAAVKVLGQYPFSMEIMDRLAEALQSRDSDLRAAVRDAMILQARTLNLEEVQKEPAKYKPLAGALAKLADTNERETQAAALSAMLYIATVDELPLLTKALASRNREVGQAAAGAIAGIKDKAALDSLIAIVEGTLPAGGDVRPGMLDYRDTAIQTLGELKDPKAVPALVKAYGQSDDKESFLRFQAFNALTKIKDPAVGKFLAGVVKDTKSRQRREALVAMREYDTPEALDAVKTALAEKENMELCVEASKWAIHHPNPKLIEPLVAIVKDESRDYDSARLALRRINTFESLVPMIRLQRCDYSALIQLGRVKDPRVMEELTKTLASGNSQTRSKALFTLRLMGDKKAMKLVEQYAKDSHPDVRKAAVLAAMALDEVAAKKLLVDAFSEPSLFGYDKAALFVKDSKQESAVLALIDGLSSPTKEIRLSCAYILRNLGDPRAVEPAKKAAQIEKDFSVKGHMEGIIGGVQQQQEILEATNRPPQEEPDR